MSRQSMGIFLLCTAAAFALRAEAFFRSVLDGDEAAYLLMARAFREGAPPYTAVFDHKPPGIYFIYALAEAVFGSAIPAMRIAACLAVASTSFLLFRIARRLHGDSRVPAVAAALLYLVFSLEIGGLAANTEIFFAPFITYAVGEALAVATSKEGQRVSAGRLLLTGVACGCALHIKYVVLFDVLLVMAVPVFIAYRLGERGAPLGRAPTLIAAGIAAPTAGVLAYFAGVGHLREYAYSNFMANAIHARNTDFSLSWLVNVTLNELSEQWLPVLCTGLMIPMLVRRRLQGRPTSVAEWLLLAWFVTSFIGGHMPRRLYTHYFLQVLPPMCLISASLIAWLLDGFPRFTDESRIHRPVLVTLLLGGPLLATALPHVSFALQAGLHRFARGEAGWGDPMTQVANHLRARMQPSDRLYVFDDEAILYLLLDRPSLTRYAFPAFIVNPHFSKVANVDAGSELESILAQRPTFIVRRALEGAVPPGNSAEIYARLDRELASGYRHEATVAKSQIFALADTKLGVRP